MKKLATLFADSYAELQHTRTVTISAMIGALSVVLGYFSIAVGNYIKIGFSTIVNQIVYYLFGPVVGGLFGGALDILKYLIKPTGAFFPGFTLSAMLAGVMYGCFFYKKTLTFKRILAAELAVSVVCNMFLGTLWLTILYGKAFMAILPMRVLKNLIMWPVNSMLLYTVIRTLETSGALKLLKASGRRQEEAGA